MEWLTQNWILIPIILGILFLLRRGGAGCGHSGGHHAHGDTSHESLKRDPVDGKSVDPATAQSFDYKGSTYYFASAENRLKFVADPDHYLAAPSGHHHRGGCC
jgi:YHS domain-containing protein